MRLLPKLLILLLGTVALLTLPVTVWAEPTVEENLPALESDEPRLEDVDEIPKTEKIKIPDHIFRDTELTLTRNGYFLNQDGEKVTMDQFRGKIVLLDFIYTTCKYGHCQHLNKKMRFLAKRFIEYVGTDIHLVSITFDPEHDTPEVLKKYSAEYEAISSRWSFLTGEAGDIVDIAKKYGIVFRWNNDDDSFNHSMRTLLLDRSGEVVGIYRGMNYKLQNAIDGIQALLDGKQLEPVDMMVPSGIGNSMMMPAH